MQQSQPLGHNLLEENIDPGCITAGVGEAGNEPQLDWVFADAEYDWDRRDRSFGGERCRDAAGNGDDG